MDSSPRVMLLYSLAPLKNSKRIIEKPYEKYNSYTFMEREWNSGGGAERVSNVVGGGAAGCAVRSGEQGAGGGSGRYLA